jgi:predicted amidophosphoribosyltransferase
MSTDLRCPNCQDNLGKDKENFVDSYCGTCGESFYNPYGYIVDQKHYEEVKKKYPNKKLPKPDNL